MSPLVKNLNRYGVPLVLVSSTIGMAIRSFQLINQKAVNILFWDQWDFYTPLFSHASFWQRFDWQHGIHRMGIGYFVIASLADLTHWNTRADSFAILGIIFLAMLAALFLKRKLYGHFSWSDITIPFIFLTATQYEIYIGTPDESAAGFPLLLLVILCLSWLCERPYLRYPFVIIASGLLIFTGYGFLIIPIVFGILLLDLFQGFRDHNNQELIYAGSSISVLFGWTLIFLNGYRFVKDTDCISFSTGYLKQYPIFMAVMASKFVGIDFTQSHRVSVIVGAVILIALVISLVSKGRLVILDKILNRKRELLIVILTAYSLVFGFSSSIGRVCLGIASSQASRYMTLLIPGFLGLYFALLTLSQPKWRTTGEVLLIGALIWGQMPYGSTDQRIIDLYSEQKANWKQCYLKYENIDQCNQITQFMVYPRTDQSLMDKFNYLKENHLNLYFDRN